MTATLSYTVTFQQRFAAGSLWWWLCGRLRLGGDLRPQPRARSKTPPDRRDYSKRGAGTAWLSPTPPSRRMRPDAL
jgi:hypothetical protein